MIFYIAYSNFEFAASSGIRKKIAGQTKVFKKAFGQAYFTMRAHEVAYLMDGDAVVEKEIAITRQDYLRILIQWIEKYEVSRTYIRYPFADQWFIELLKYQRDNNIRTVVEIPTYPYDGELAYGRIKVEDGYYRRMVPKYIDKLSIFSLDTTIWGIPCINLVNGIEIEDHLLTPIHHEKGRLVMICVASGMPWWNGYERLLEGLKHYIHVNGSYQIKIKFVGKGIAENDYKKLAVMYGLEKQVDFCGLLSGTDLDQAYQEADIAIDALGAYKKGIRFACSLKGAEYCARGIPTVCGYTDTRFPDDAPFILKVPNDDSPIDIPSVIAFYEKLSAENGYRERIREFAVQHLTWDSIMQPIVDYLQ